MRLRIGQWGAALGLFCLALVGCAKRTTPVTIARSNPGEMGFGAATHEQAFFGGKTVVAAVGHAAVSDDEMPPGLPGDALWQAYHGGLKLRHCATLPDRSHACRDAELPEDVETDSLIIVDPKNLGRSLTVTRLVGHSDGGWVYGSPIDLDDTRPLRATSSHGIWVRRTSSLRPPWHCQLEADGQPRCRSVLPDDPNVTFFGAVYGIGNVLGVFVQADADVLWIGRLGYSIVRCTASRDGPQPVCVTATME